MLKVDDLSAGYGHVEVLWDVGLEVGEREIVSLVGSNGAGKTTLLRTISGVLTPTSGSINWDGENIGGLAPERVVGLGIAHVPEGRRLFAGLTVRENLIIGAYSRRDGHGELERVVELFPRLGERIDQAAGSLSGGEQQMCAIARGLMAKPKLLMIDELSLGLAPKLVDQLLERVEEIPERGTSILLVEQDVDAALRLARRAYVMETGRIVLTGPGEELLNDPRVREAYLG
ncbi:MAG: ABC transporter ATP-binding protein, partial [Candidatus Limnocylindria bacterium]